MSVSIKKKNYKHYKIYRNAFTCGKNAPRSFFLIDITRSNEFSNLQKIKSR